MLHSNLMRGALLAASLMLPALPLAADIVVSDAYARVSRPDAPTGAAFMTIRNTGDTNDRLLSVASEVAKRVELHTHIDQGDGIMKMSRIEGGIPVPAGATHKLARGGDHVMLMGLTQPLEQGQEISFVLTFEEAGDVVITLPVDNERQPDHGMLGHGQMMPEKTN